MTGRALACVSGERVHAKAERARYLYPHPHKGQSTNRPKMVVGNVSCTLWEEDEDQVTSSSRAVSISMSLSQTLSGA